MANKYRKILNITIIVREIQIKTTIRLPPHMH